MKKIIFVISFMALLVGCNDYKEKYEDAVNEKEELEQRISVLEDELQESQDRVAELEGIIDNASSEAAKLSSDLFIWEDDPWMLQGDVNRLKNSLTY